MYKIILNFLLFKIVLCKKRFYYSSNPLDFKNIVKKEIYNFNNFYGVILEENEYNNTELKNYIKDEKMYLYKNDIGYNRWGLDRINQHNNILDDIYHNRNTGDGIEVYIIDSGIETTHEILKHNSQMIKDFTKDNDMIDYNGHGTHVAGIIGGLYYGVASNVKIYGIKVFDATGVGSTITIIEAMYEVLKRC